MREYAQAHKEATEVFLNLVASLKPSDLDSKDAEGWTPRQVIHHLADSEAQAYARLRRLIAEPGTTIQGYDEGKWVENQTLNYEALEIEDSLAVIKPVRQSSYALILRMNPAELLNAGTHSESGAYSVKSWLESYTNHPVDHANQIRTQIGAGNGA